jgi:hypothetical protein
LRAGDNDARRVFAQSHSTAEHSFDDLARGLASGSISRGKALRLLGGALAGAALASVPGVGWAVKKTGTGTVNQTNTGDQVATNSGNQSSSSTQSQFNPGGRGGDGGVGGDAVGGGNSTCAQFCRDTFPPGPQRGECISAGARGEGPCFGTGSGCPDGQTLCQGQCRSCPVGEQLNPETCECDGGGGCLEGCDASLCLVCDEASGLCVSKCQSGAGCCSGVCTPLNTVSNCGGCGVECLAGTNETATCVAGACGALCTAGFADCDPNVGGCETNTNTNVNNCGRCGNACTAGTNQTATCVGGVCGTVCNTGFADCNDDPTDGCETNTNTDVNNCGACDNACTAGTNQTATCVGGVCGTVCNTGFADCDPNVGGCETNTNTNVNNCGRCGNVCPAPTGGTATCTGGVCGGTCTSRTYCPTINRCCNNCNNQNTCL